MRSKKAEAVATLITTAPKNNHYNGKYHNPPVESSAKSLKKLAERVGELLFSLQNPSLSKKDRAAGWTFFESALRRYVDLKICGGTL